MTLARKDRLNVLGLLPLWRQREAVAVADAASGQNSGMADDWALLEAEIRACTRCPLHATRLHAVPGSGDLQADWLIVGEAPGAEEDRQGEPFVGQAADSSPTLWQAMRSPLSLRAANWAIFFRSRTSPGA